jgi:SAM-dependent methyltransferase
LNTTDFYDRHAAALADRYDGIDPDRLHGAWLPLLEARPAGLACDIGAGSGRDARWLARRGWEVVAVEPSAAMRERGVAATRDLAVTWLDDALPGLRSLSGSGYRFDLVCLQAVWQHLDPRQRPEAFLAVAELLAPSALLVISLRHGRNEKENRERGFYSVGSKELLSLARSRGMTAVLQSRHADLTRADVDWEMLVLTHPSA